MTVYHLRVKLFDNLTNWQFPRIPRSSSDIEKLKEEANDLAYVYEKIAIFDGSELVEELK